MTSTTHTGGLKKFVYSNQNERPLSEEEREGIREAYRKVEKRKRRNKIIEFSIVGLIILALILFKLLK